MITRLLCRLTRHQGWQFLSDPATLVVYSDERGVWLCGRCDAVLA
jgi:hypothetical protein